MIDLLMIDLLMIDLGKDATFIWTCYGVSAAVLGLLVLRTWQKPRR